MATSPDPPWEPGHPAHSQPILDLRGGDSPVLALLVRRALARLQPGQRLEVWLTSPRWARDLPLILRRSGDRCLGCREDGEGYRLLLARGGPPAL